MNDTTTTTTTNPTTTDTNNEEIIQNAIAVADPYRGCGTSYLHTDLHTKTTVEGTTITNDDDNNSYSNPSGAIVPPISLATTFQQRIPGQGVNPNDPNSFGKGYEYSRTGNPTRGIFERAMGHVEHTIYPGIAFASGSAATSAVIHSIVQHGDHILCIDDVYGGTQRYLRKIVAPIMGIHIDFCDFSEPYTTLPFKTTSSSSSSSSSSSETVSTTTTTTGITKLIWLETPTNPTLKISDIQAISKYIKLHHPQCILAVDNTFCSPYFQSPLLLGADIVVHSVTKYIGGHSDVVMGVVCTNSLDIYNKLRFVQNSIGAVPSPFDCYLAHRGLKTLHLRMEASARNAYAIALYLESHPAIRRVLYPGLPSHPQHELAKRQQHGFGSMITFYANGGRTESACILQNLRVFALAESLGAVESLAECPSLMTHASVPDEERSKLGIDDSLIRLSVGVESCNDLINDLRSALESVLSLKTSK